MQNKNNKSLTTLLYVRYLQRPQSGVPGGALGSLEDPSGMGKNANMGYTKGNME